MGHFQLLLPYILVLIPAYHAQGDDKSIGLCDQSWFPVYEHDTTGWEIKGRKADLQKHLESGHLCKVVFTTSSSHLLSLPLDEFHLRGFDVCGTSSWILSDDETKLEDNADWLPTVVCTTGQVNRVNFTSTGLVRDVEGNGVNVTGTITWFTKATSCEPQPVYSHFFDGSDVYGSLQKLVKVARASALTVKMRDRGYYFRSQNTKTYGNKLVTVQSLNHLSLKHTFGGMEHNDRPFYEWHGAWSSDGRRDVSRWFLNDTTLWSHENEHVALDWFGDECWRKVMAMSRTTGKVKYGSLDELAMMIKLGHKVRVHFDGFSLRALNVRLVDGGVVAMTTEEFARRGNFPQPEAPYFNSNARIVYRLIHSNGMVRSYMFTIDNYTLSETSSSMYDVDWYVDTRPWTQVYRTIAVPAPTGDNSTNTTSPAVPADSTNATAATEGDSQILRDAVARGASIRVGIQEQFSDGQVFLDLDNIRTNLNTNETFAQSVKGVYIHRPDGESEYSVPTDVSQLAFLVTSEGLASSRKLSLSTRNLLINYVSSTASITWFVNN